MADASHRHRASFLLSAFSQPALVGALLPSSRWLAGAMVDAASGARLLVDLGAGTGAITEALLKRHPAACVMAVEMQAHLADLLELRFPQIEVRRGSAHDVLESLHDAPPDTVLVSSLPFRSLPARWREPTIAAVVAFLRRGQRRRLVQYTYQPRAPFDLRGRESGLRWSHERTVWRNAPPAGVWTLQTP
jgi:phosphatidylethanolamine/phosphatidyl-N-methylethanolamine N-methyltransferase